MKLRFGFVANSSSSSYTCNTCGDTESGWDISLREIDWWQCENGHNVCCGCKIGGDAFDSKAIKDLYVEELQSRIKSYTESLKKNPAYHDYKEWIADNQANLDAILPLEGEELQDYIDDNYDEINDELELRYNAPASICPVCSMMTIEDEDLLSYISKTHNIDLNITRNEIGDKFKTYKEFMDYLDGK